ncbi:MAG: class I SAM-dependent methyltransferase, partial [Chloroflexota bacterium]
TKMIAALNNKQLRNVDTLAVALSEEAIEINELLHTKFDLIVASSVCAFLPDYEGTLKLMKRLLKPDGLFIQWDWQQTEADPEFGFTKAMIEAGFLNAGLSVVSITNPFSLESEKGVMQVLMGVAKNG